MPAPRARSSTEIADSGRSPSSRSAVARIAASRSSPEGRAVRRPRVAGGRAVDGPGTLAAYRRQASVLNTLSTEPTGRR